MIQELTLVNFQIHKKIKIEFDEKFNVIVGHNNMGKSSIIRAIFWVLYNEPSGDWMRRINEKGEMEETSVKIKFFNGDIVKRIKGTGLNKYVVNGDEYENFGYGVPQRVKEIIGISQFKTNKIEFPLNIFMQDDLPFMIHETGPIKASVVDVLTGVSLLQKAITEFNKDRLENTRLSKIKQDQINEDKEQLEKLPDMKKLKELMEQCKLRDIEKSRLEFEINNAETLKQKWQFAVNLLEKLKDKEIDMDRIIKVKDKLEKVTSVLEKLKHLRERYNKVKDCIDISEAELKVHHVLNELDVIDNIDGEIKKLKFMKDHYEGSETRIKEVEKEMPKLEEELKQVWKEIKVCPLCGVKK